MSSPPASRTSGPAPRAADDFHPLEIVPFFRRWAPGLARDLLYTLIWSSAIGAGFWILGILFTGGRSATWEHLRHNLLMANTIGYILHAIFVLTSRLGIDAWARGVGPWFTVVYYSLVSAAGVLAGFVLVFALLDPRALRHLADGRWIASMAIVTFVLSGLIAGVFFAREREARAEAEIERERLRAERVEREALSANLRALQAQIEPHFLFNTLANVESLIEADPACARRMLASFNRFLRASLAATRTERTTLGAEAELIRAYLDVLQVRMGERLRYAIEVPAELAAFELPPMLLQPVVENAIRHGLEPRVAGGEVRLAARRAGAAVVVEVADTGAGFAPTTRGGVGLTNVRDRLRLIYGPGARLAIGENAPRGTRVTIELPA